MEDDDNELKDDSSFEVLSSCDEDDSYRSALNFSSFEESLFETASASCDSLNDEADDNNDGEEISNTNSPLSMNLNLQMDSLLYPELNSKKYYIIKNQHPCGRNIFPDIPFDGVFCSMENYNANPCIVTSAVITSISESNKSTVTETPGFLDYYKTHDEIEKTDTERNHVARKDVPRTLKNVSVTEPLVSDTIEEVLVIDQEYPQRYDRDKSYVVNEPENGTLQLRRCNCREKLTKALRQSVSWLRCNKYLQNFLEGAKASFNSLINVVETEVNLLLGVEHPLKIVVIAEATDSMAIEEAFCRAFDGQVSVSIYAKKMDLINPALPVGHLSALQTAQAKIHNAKRFCNFETDAVVVSTARFIAEIIPQRWQMSTVLCLEDPKLNLNLHNFTLTVPVPNEYVNEAQRLTPHDYPYKDYGLGVTLEDAIDYMIKTESDDTQGFLTGVNHYITMKSAALVLVGMYEKYAQKFKGQSE